MIHGRPGSLPDHIIVCDTDVVVAIAVCVYRKVADSFRDLAAGIERSMATNVFSKRPRM